MPGKIAVREVETGDIHPGVKHFPQDLGRFGCRSDRAYELCFIGGKRHGSILLIVHRCVPRHGLLSTAYGTAYGTA